jgi:L-ribulose-5-phosphate 4-epimerase
MSERFEIDSTLLHDCLWLNCKLPESNLVKLTWGNASIYKNTSVAIKPSGVQFSMLEVNDISLLNLADNKLHHGKKPSVDTPMHIEIYKFFPGIKAIIHTHSTYATSWAQAGLPIPCMGTTHADHFMGEVPVIRHLEENELISDYEANLGKIVVEHFVDNNQSPEKMPAILLRNHGCLVFGKTKEEALSNAIALEEVAHMAFNTKVLNNQMKTNTESDRLYNIHFERKHGNNKYYGQK